MRHRIHLVLLCCLLTGAHALAEIIDRTTIVVGRQVVKASDINRDIRITSFLNGEPPDFSPAAQKQAAGRLIDQALIREQIRIGEFQTAPAGEAERLLEATRKDRFGDDDMLYRRALTRYGVSEKELLERLRWQLTVLRFIDARFRPAVVVSEEEVGAYSQAHAAELLKAHPEAAGIDALKRQVTQIIEGQRINQLLDEWLNQSRKETRIDYLEKSLQ